MKKVKLINNRYYLLPSNVLVKILLFNNYLNTIVIRNYQSKQNEVIEVSLAERIFTPVFRLSEVAAALGKKPETIRRYERSGELSRARQIPLGQRGSMRIYTREEVDALAEFFDERVVGRPSKRATMHGPVNKDRIQEMYNKIHQE